MKKFKERTKIFTTKKENFCEKYAIDKQAMLDAYYSMPSFSQEKFESLKVIIHAMFDYAVNKNLIEECDRIYCTNSVMYLLKRNAFDDSCNAADGELNEILDKICDYAAENGIIEDSITYRDLFDTAVMGVLTPRPSEVISKFYSLYDGKAHTNEEAAEGLLKLKKQDRKLQWLHQLTMPPVLPHPICFLRRIPLRLQS
mgnify:CR=1 FL=1